MMEREDSTPLLSHIEVPTLIVHGAEDALIPIAEAESMHRAIPRSEYQPMPGSGHLPNLEQPDAFNARLGQFLGTL
jgi:pimeloyl-ACP methyl ester carboxylesterase